MYDYTKLTAGYSFHSQPADNMMLNGKWIDEEIYGYRQLNVGGRSLISRELNITEIPKRPGTWFNYAQDQAREITVQYKLEADSSEGLRNKYARLNQLLRETNDTGLSELKFNDELDYVYYGVFAEAKTDLETALSIVSTFTMYCPDPYKYKTANVSTNGKITLYEAEAVTPRRIVVTVGSGTDTVEIVNNEHRIVLEGSYDAGETIEVVWGDEVEITYKHRSILVDLQQFSDLENFVLKHGDVVTAINADVTLVEWSDKRL